MKVEVRFAAYTGLSMHPTLREAEVMEIAPYNNRPVQVGDVIFFTPPTQSQAVVHRVIQITPAGIRSQGDNNLQPDDYLLQSAHITGQVVAAWRGQQRRKIAGGWQGRLARGWLRWRRGLWWNLYRPAFRLAQPVYQFLLRRGIVTRLLPPRLKPRLVVFQSANGSSQPRLMWGRRVIGYYDNRLNRWIIYTPFRLLVDERILSK